MVTNSLNTNEHCHNFRPKGLKGKSYIRIHIKSTEQDLLKTPQQRADALFANVQPLPRPWQMLMDDNYNFYYYNPATNLSQWNRP
ncbi:hypothetical protein BC941DRAFT_11300 [Chlamydoabsidia padenii]|nr:hypothetical protein BC941DRAFT_11300 [Chlamydoabsidia padenii]